MRLSNGDPHTNTFTPRDARNLTEPVNPTDAPLLLTDAQAAALAGLSRRTVWSLVSQGLFPAPVKVPGVRMTRWKRSDVQAWVDALEEN